MWWQCCRPRVRAAKRPDGKFQTEIVSKVFTDYADPHAKDCALK